MATITGALTLNEISIIEVSGDPSATGGTPSPKGSIALDNTGKLWLKFGDADTNWSEMGAGSVGALLAANNLSDLSNAVTARTNLGLGNVDNTSDANKPVSTATQTALNSKENSITAGTTSQYFRGDKTFQTLDKNVVGLANVDNTSDVNKPISTATKTYVDSKSFKQAVKVSSAGSNVDLSSAPLNIDFTAMSNGDRVLIMSQTNDAENGIYIYNGFGNAMTRAEDADTAAKLKDAYVYVAEGSNAYTILVQYGTITTLGTDPVIFIFPAVGYHQQTVDTLLPSGATNGQYLQFNGTNWVPVTAGAGGGTTVNTVTADIDFGAAENDFAQVTVSASWVLSTSTISLTILPNSLDHDPEDVLLEELKCTYGNIIDNTSFDIYVHAPNNTFGRYKIKIQGV
jgi:archaellum component FlaF (FlaF/FlaG flagellin family)